MIAMNDILSTHANFTPPMRFSLFTPHAAKHAGVTIAYVMKSAEFLSECGRAKCFSQSSKSNELIFNTMFFLVAWLSGNALVSINEVTLRRARLVPGWVTVCERVNYLVM